MPRINEFAFEGLLKEFNLLDQKTKGTAQRMLREGASILIAEQRIQTEKLFQKYTTGQTWSAIKQGPIKEDSVEVWPHGRRRDWKHPHGERNETIGFVLQYGGKGGRRRMTPRPFMTAGLTRAEDKITTRWEEIWNEG